MSIALISLKQGDSIAAYRIVRLTSANTVSIATATTDILLGVTQDNASSSNQAVPVAIGGIARIFMNETCAAGTFVTTDSSGRGTPMVVNTAGVYVVGQVLSAVSATGTLAEILLRPQQISIP